MKAKKDTGMRIAGKNAEKRTTILQAAAELFATRDFHQVLMDEVAEHAQVGKGTLYRYFPTKEDLYFVTIFEGWDRLREELEAALEAKGSLEVVLGNATRQILAYFWDRHQLVTLVHRLEQVTSDPDNPESPAQVDWRRKRESIVDLIEGVLRKGLKTTAPPSCDTRLLTEMLLGMMRSAVLYRSGHDTAEAVAQLLVRLFLDGLHGHPWRSALPHSQTQPERKTQERSRVSS